MTDSNHHTYLHIGHGKTGSSYFQSLLSLNSEKLQHTGVCYPRQPDHELATACIPTSGNITLEKLITFTNTPPAEKPSIRKTILSNESLFNRLVDSPKILEQVAKNIEDLSIILIIRDPLPHALSLYNQRVKRQGETGTLLGFLNTYDTPARVERFLKHADDLGITVWLRNYSRHEDNICEVICQHIGFSTEMLELPKDRIVNRSLTPSELYLQRRFNHIFGQQSYDFVSAPLIREVHEIAASETIIPPKCLERFIQTQLASVESVNGRIEADESYQLPAISKAETADLIEDGNLVFTPTQIDTLVYSIAEHMERHKPAGLIKKLFRRLKHLCR